MHQLHLPWPLLLLLPQAVSTRLGMTQDSAMHQLQLLRLLLPDLDESIVSKRAAAVQWAAVGDQITTIKPGPRGGNLTTLDLRQEESQIMTAVQQAIRYGYRKGVFDHGVCRSDVSSDICCWRHCSSSNYR